MKESAVKEMLVVGKVTGCYGLKVWVKMYWYMEALENFQGFGAWQVMRRGIFEPIEFDTLKRRGRGLVGQIAGVDERNLAVSDKGLEVTVPVSALLEMP